MLCMSRGVLLIAPPYYKRCDFEIYFFSNCTPRPAEKGFVLGWPSRVGQALGGIRMLGIGTFRLERLLWFALLGAYALGLLAFGVTRGYGVCE